jgi:ABC-type transport system involved in multi-copper enzyme maturation permease subunit
MAEPATLPPRPRTLRAGQALSVVGPLFFYDVVRLARRGRSTLLRCVYALALFGNLYVTYHQRFPRHDLLAAPFTPQATVRPAELSRMAEEFVYSILWLQTAAIYVLTPAYLAGALAEEKERGTLELLFTTHLTDREIVIGKLAARLAHLAGVLLAGVPLLVLTQLWGGVDIRLLTAAFVLSAFNLLSVGAISVFSSAVCPTVTLGMLASYLLTGVLFFISSICPFGAMTSPVGLFELITEQASDLLPSAAVAPIVVAAPGSQVPLVVALALGILLHGSVAIFFAAAAVTNLRPAVGMPVGAAPPSRGPIPVSLSPAPRPSSPSPKPVGFGYVELPAEGTERPTAWRSADWRPASPARSPAPARPKPAEGWGPFDKSESRPSVARASQEARPNLPPVGNWPLLWKETHYRRQVDPQNERALWLGLVGVPLAFVLVILLAQDEIQARWTAMSGSLPRLAVLLSAGVWGVVLAFRAVAGISRERDGGTLEGLLTLPVSRSTILGAKWLGPFVYSRYFGGVVAVVIVVEVATGVLHPDAAVLLALAILAHMAFLVSLGVWLSLSSRNTLWARVSMALVLLVFLGIGVRFLLPAARARAYATAAPTPAPAVQTFVGPPPVAPRPWNLLPWPEYVVDVGLNAPGNWWFLNFSPQTYARVVETGDPQKTGDPEFVAQLAVATGSIVAYGLAARLLWALACLRFRGEQRR